MVKMRFGDMLFDYIPLTTLENRHTCKMYMKFCYIRFFKYYFKSGTIHAPPHHSYL